MSEHEARARGLYDREEEELGGGRRRRQVADWGVGEDVFDRLPSRRFARSDSRHARRRLHEPATRDPERPVDANPTRERPGVPAGGGIPGRSGLSPLEPPRPAAPNGRRTIVIGGRPDPAGAVRPVHRRPPRTAVERIGARPDRIVGYIVAIGLLLIILAILTAGH